MTTPKSQRISRGGVLWALLLALAGVGLATMAVSVSSASVPTNGAVGTAGTGAQAPDGGGCWTEISTQNVMTGGNYLVAMDGDPDTGAILAAGYYTTDISLDGGFGRITQMVQFYTGSSFQIVPNPPGLGDGRLNGVGAIPGTNNEFWVVGTTISQTMTTTFSINLIERFDGSSLSIAPIPHRYDGTNGLADVDAASPNFAIAVGRVLPSGGGQPRGVIVMWNGSSWALETPPTLPGPGWELNGVATFPDGRAVAVGIDYGGNGRQVVLIRATNGVWTQGPTIQPGSGARLTAVDAVSPTDIVAVGYRDTLSGIGPHAMLGNLDTNTWTFEYLPVRSAGGADAVSGGGDTRANAVSCNPEGACYAGGEYDDGTTTESDGWVRGVIGGFVRADPGSIRAFGVLFAAVHGFIEDIEQAQGSVSGMYAATNYWNVGELNRVAVQRYEVPCGGGGPTPTPGPATSTPAPPTSTPSPSPSPTACTPHVYSDVPTDHTFYAPITCLSQRGVISGYPDCTFRPGNDVTRGQLAKIISESAGLNQQVTGQTFEDVPPSNPFWLFIERLAGVGAISGYNCGGPGEPCVPPQNRPYFRWGANASRGQISKITAVTAGWNGPIPPTQQTFEDVPPSNPFWTWIEELASRNIISGYPCGGTGEPCGPASRPYFRWGNNATRGQMSKIAVNTFFPNNCQPSGR